MYNEYYFTDQYQEPVYCSIISMNNSVETSLYIGRKLFKRSSLHMGQHQLVKDNMDLHIQLKWFKVILELRIDNEPVPFRKVKRKELKAKLMDLGITNEINPNVGPKEPFNYRRLKGPFILITVGVTWQVLTEGSGKFWEVPAMILFIIAYAQIFSPVIDRVPDRHLDADSKGKFKFLAGMAGMIITLIITSKITNSF